jgi:membrane-bound serine protease (ClpP class)
MKCRSMHRRSILSPFRKLLLLTVSTILLVPSAASADVVKVVVDSVIHPLSAEYVDRAVQEAERTHADAVLIEIRTPGGLMTSMEDIVHKVLDSKVPVIIYVSPSGKGASSAGFFILEAADIAAMAPGTNTGAAHPVRGDGQIMDPVMKDKVENYAASLMRSYVSKRGRNVEVAESAVRQSKSFTADEALSQHLIDYIAKDQDDLFKQIDGKSVTRFDGSRAVLHVAGKPVRLYDMTLRERILSVLMDPNFTALLFTLGLFALMIEFNHPGGIVPGAVGLIAIVVSIYALQMLPTRFESVAMVIGAFVLFALEAKFHSHGLFTLGGMLMMVLGLLLLVDGPIPEMRVRLITALSVTIPLGAITVFLLTLAIRARRNKVVTGKESLIGEIGVARSPLVPDGKVFVRGALWNAVASANVEIGQAVIVRNVQDLTLQVEPAMQSVTLDAAKS